MGIYSFFGAEVNLRDIGGENRVVVMDQA